MKRLSRETTITLNRHQTTSRLSRMRLRVSYKDIQGRWYSLFLYIPRGCGYDAVGGTGDDGILFLKSVAFGT